MRNRLKLNLLFTEQLSFCSSCQISFAFMCIQIWPVAVFTCTPMVWLLPIIRENNKQIKILHYIFNVVYLLLALLWLFAIQCGGFTAILLLFTNTQNVTFKRNRSVCCYGFYLPASKLLFFFFNITIISYTFGASSHQ